MTAPNRSRNAVARTDQLLTHATDLILVGGGAVVDSLTAMAIGSLQLRVFALLEPGCLPPRVELPGSVGEAVVSAADQTADWDYSQLPPESVEVAVALRDVAEALNVHRVLP